MAVSNGKSCGVRRTRNRRIEQIQGLNDKEIQAVKAILASIEATLDTYRDTSTERLVRSLRAVLPAGFGTLLREIHHALSERILQSGLYGVQLDTKGRKLRKDRRKNKPSGNATKRRGLSKNARAGLPDGFSVTPTYSDENVHGSGKRLYQFNARQPNRRSKRSGGEREVPTDSERCDLYGGTYVGACPRCED